MKRSELVGCSADWSGLKTRRKIHKRLGGRGIESGKGAAAEDCFVINCFVGRIEVVNFFTFVRSIDTGICATPHDRGVWPHEDSSAIFLRNEDIFN